VPASQILQSFRDMDKFRMAETEGHNKAMMLELSLGILYEQTTREAFKIVFINPFIRLKNIFKNAFHNF